MWQAVPPERRPRSSGVLRCAFNSLILNNAASHIHCNWGSGGFCAVAINTHRDASGNIDVRVLHNKWTPQTPDGSSHFSVVRKPLATAQKHLRHIPAAADATGTTESGRGGTSIRPPGHWDSYFKVLGFRGLIMHVALLAATSPLYFMGKKHSMLHRPFSPPVSIWVDLRLGPDLTSSRPYMKHAAPTQEATSSHGTAVRPSLRSGPKTPRAFL